MEHVIKTFEGAVAKLGRKHPYVKAYESLRDFAETQPDIVAYAKLRIICTALNDGWVPKFTEEEERWQPWFWAERDTSGVIIGIGYGGSRNLPPTAFPCVGSRICLKNFEISRYCGKQFVEVWEDYYLSLQ